MQMNMSVKQMMRGFPGDNKTTKVQTEMKANIKTKIEASIKAEIKAKITAIFKKQKKKYNLHINISI